MIRQPWCRPLLGISLGLVVAICSQMALAAALPSGAVLVPAPGEPDPTGGAVVASKVSPFTVPGSFSGTLTTTVLSGDPSNALGGLTFTYELTNDGKAGVNSIGRMTVVDFAGWLVDASYQSTSVGVVPGSIDRQPSGEVIGFNFLPTPADPLTAFLVPGTSSRVLVLQTNAPSWNDVLASLIDGGVTQTASFGPVPEPSTWVLLGLGMALLAWRRRR
jgi:hypothetical protein